MRTRGRGRRRKRGRESREREAKATDGPFKRRVPRPKVKEEKRGIIFPSRSRSAGKQLLILGINFLYFLALGGIRR